MGRQRANHEEWQKRVERWTDSGLSAKQFAAETGINAGTLQWWKCRLRKQAGEQPRVIRRKGSRPIVSSLIEVRPLTAVVDDRFEIELNNGRRLRVPRAFEANAVKALVAALEAAP